MSTKDKILQWAKTHSPFSSSALTKHLGIARQNVAGHLSQLVEAGKLTKEGSTRGARYSYQATTSVGKSPKRTEILLHKRLKGLEEDRVFQEIERKLNLHRQLGKKAYSIAAYAFTEMLNNAIDHSGSPNVRIKLSLSQKDFAFSIRDFGVGAFAKVQKSFGLQTEFDAMEHIFKGKQTTDPERHSGEGIFFTSRIADRFTLRSNRLSTKVDNEVSDLFVKEDRNLKGTHVEFSIRRQTKKVLSDLFKKFTNADFQFDKNQIRVKLSGEGGLLSRSQAKRLLAGLDRYAQITFDFKGVDEIGQGFADEIFRVFRNSHPNIQLQFANANSIVTLMVQRAFKQKS